MITTQQFYLVDNLTSVLEKASPIIGGRLICEAQKKTSVAQIRIPDIACFSKDQISQVASGTQVSVAEFVIEIVSDNGKFNKVHGILKQVFR